LKIGKLEKIEKIGKLGKLGTLPIFYHQGQPNVAEANNADLRVPRMNYLEERVGHKVFSECGSQSCKPCKQHVLTQRRYARREDQNISSTSLRAFIGLLTVSAGMRAA
jgi:hypothetical protein